MRRRAVLTILAWMCLVGIASAQTLSFPTLSGRVIDEANVLEAADRVALTESLASLEAKTTDQFVVVTLKSLQGTSIEDYGYQLGRRWQLGQKDKNNGVLLIVVPSERNVRIEVGYGLEGALTDAMTKIVIENSILPQFKNGNYSAGIKRGVEDIVQVLSGDAEGWQRRLAQTPSSNAARPQAELPIWLVIVFFVGGVGLLIFCSARGGAVCNGILQIFFLMLLSGRGRSSHRGATWSGGGGSFGGGGSSGKW